MSEPKKTNKGLVVLVVVAFLGLVGYIYGDQQKRAGGGDNAVLASTSSEDLAGACRATLSRDEFLSQYRTNFEQAGHGETYDRGRPGEASGKFIKLRSLLGSTAHEKVVVTCFSDANGRFESYRRRGECFDRDAQRIPCSTTRVEECKARFCDWDVGYD